MTPRLRFWVWLADFATRRANNIAPPHHGMPPYQFLVPVQEGDYVE